MTATQNVDTDQATREASGAKSKRTPNSGLIGDRLDHSGIESSQHRVRHRSSNEQEFAAEQERRVRDPLACRTAMADGDHAVRLGDAGVRPSFTRPGSGAEQHPAAERRCTLHRGGVIGARGELARAQDAGLARRRQLGGQVGSDIIARDAGVE